MNQNNYVLYSPLSAYVSATTSTITVNAPVGQYVEGFICLITAIPDLVAEITFTGDTFSGASEVIEKFYYNYNTNKSAIYPFKGTFHTITISATALNGLQFLSGSFLQTYFAKNQELGADIPGLSTTVSGETTNTNAFAYATTGSQEKTTNILAKKRQAIMSINQPMTTELIPSHMFVGTTNSGNTYTLASTNSMLLWPALRQGIANDDTVIITGSVDTSYTNTFSIEYGNSVFRFSGDTGTAAYSFGRTRVKGELELALTNVFPTTVAGNYTISVFGVSVPFAMGVLFNSSSGPVVAAGICDQIAETFTESGILVTYAGSSLYFREINSEVFVNPIAAPTFGTTSSVTASFTTIVAATNGTTDYIDFLGTVYSGPGFSQFEMHNFAMILTKSTASIYVSVPNKDNMICAGTIGNLQNSVADYVPSFYAKNNLGTSIDMTVSSIIISVMANKKASQCFTISHLGGLTSATQMLRKYALNCITSIARNVRGTVFELNQIVSGGIIAPATYSINYIRYINPLADNMSITSSDGYAFWAEGYSVADDTSASYCSVSFDSLLSFRPPVFENVGIIAKPMLAGSPRPLLVFNVYN